MLTNLNIYFLYWYGTQALCATTARLRVPCRVLPRPPIFRAKSSRICETSTALSDWIARVFDVYLVCVRVFLQSVGVLGSKKNLSFS